MDDTPVLMVRDNLEDLPSHTLPPGYRVRKFRKGEARLWAQVEAAAGEFESAEAALARFIHEFGDRLDEMEDRCLFLVDENSGRVIGTATAWYDLGFEGEDYGRVHWVAIVPEYQGRKLAKPLMCAVMERLRQSHAKAYLVTHTKCVKAIRMYLDFGFRPLHKHDTCEEAWRHLAGVLDHPALPAV